MAYGNLLQRALKECVICNRPTNLFWSSSVSVGIVLRTEQQEDVAVPWAAVNSIPTARSTTNLRDNSERQNGQGRTLTRRWWQLVRVSREVPDMSAAGGSKSSSSSGSMNYVSLKPIEVPEALQSGEKFIKWDEVTMWWIRCRSSHWPSFSPGVGCRRRRRRRRRQFFCCFGVFDLGSGTWYCRLLVIFYHQETMDRLGCAIGCTYKPLPVGGKIAFVYGR